MGALKELSFEFKGRLIAVDDDGYLVNPGDWSEELAEYLTLRDGLTLTDDHWEVIRFIRGYFTLFQSSPMPKVMIKALNKRHGGERFTIKSLFALFAATPVRNACKYAGVPWTAGCT